MIPPSDVEAHRVPLHIDTVSSSSNGSHLSKPIMSRISREPSPSREEVITLPAIQTLNQPTVLLDIEHYRYACALAVVTAISMGTSNVEYV